MTDPRARHALLVYPRFAPNSFWNYQATCETVGKRYSATPLGMITVAALLPKSWEVRLVDCNVDELTDSDLAWADLVMTGGMLSQQIDAFRVIELARARGKRVVVGGPDVTSSPQRYAAADFRVLGEAEDVIPELVAALETGADCGTFAVESFPDVRRSPVPRFELLKLERYMHVGIQVTRGCPYSCEFCNVIELNGRNPRVKDPEQVVGELEALYALGYRGHVDFVDDNLTGNRRAIRPVLERVAAWVAERGYPFEFSTELSLNVADDPEILGLMKKANFFACFVGVETPDTEALRASNKKQNVGRDVEASIHALYRAGLFVNAGFIVGFDAERRSVAGAMVECIEQTAIPVAMVGLLYALPNTGLYHRLSTEGRLHENADRPAEGDADQTTSGLNFETLRPRAAVLADYREVIERIYEPRAFFGRVRRMVRALDVRGHRLRQPVRHVVRDLRAFGRISWRSLRDPETRWLYLRALVDALWHNPRAAKIMVSMAALFLHYKPFARHLTAQVARRIAAEMDRAPELPVSAPSSVATSSASRALSAGG